MARMTFVAAEGGLICTGAATSIFNLALHLIRAFGTEELASVCSKALLVDPNRDSQAPYLIFTTHKSIRLPSFLDRPLSTVMYHCFGCTFVPRMHKPS
jgi:transcriptional regulator GlxA family with amidase domain